MDTHLSPRTSLLIALVLLPVAVTLLLLRPRADAPRLVPPPSASASVMLAQHFLPGHRRGAPHLHGQMLQGTSAALVLVGRVTAINFWASWCAPCKREARELAAYAARPGTQLIGIDTNDARGDALAFIRRYGLQYPNLSNSDGSLSTAYGAPGLPTTIVIDAQGRIAEILAGPQTVQSLARAVARAQGRS